MEEYSTHWRESELVLKSDEFLVSVGALGYSTNCN